MKKVGVFKIKILSLSLIPIIIIIAVIGIEVWNLVGAKITNEIERQLYTTAYIFQNQYGTDIEKLVFDTEKFCKDTGIDITFFDGKERILSTIPSAVGTSIDFNIYNHIQSGRNYFVQDANVNGRAYFGYYIPVMENEKYVGAVFTGIPQLAAKQDIADVVIRLMTIILVVGGIVGVIAFIIASKSTKSINKLQNMIGTLLQNDLSATHEKIKNESDEIDTLCNESINFANQLKDKVVNIKDVSKELQHISEDMKESLETTSNAASEIAGAVEDVARGANSQAEEITNATQRIGSIAEDLNKIGINANELNSVAKAVNIVKKNAMDLLVILKKLNKETVQDVQNMSTQVDITSESVKKIQEAVDVIKNIAGQTKLLSLNANIEAARAGEAGRGFSVVASNIGELAAQSASSSEAIEKILKDLTKNYALIEENMNVTSKNMILQSQKIDETYESFNSLETNITSTVSKVNSINSMIEAININIVEIVDIIANLSAISQENSASTEETMASVEGQAATTEQITEKATHVAEVANKLLSQVDVFKIN